MPDKYKVVRSPIVEDLELPEIHYHNDIDQPAIDISSLPSGIAHSSLSGVTSDQHHARDHVTRHLAGGGDPFTGANILTYQEVDTTTWAKNIIPEADNTRDLGSTTKDFANIYGNTIRGKAITDRMGTSTSYNDLVSVANVNTTAVGNVDAGEDDLITYALPANSLSATGEGIRITAWGTGANNANAKTLKVYFGTQVILTTSLTTGQVDTWRAESIVLRTGANTQDWSSQLLQAGTTSLIDVENGTATQTDSGAITIKLTGEATTTNDIIQEGLVVEYLN